MFCVAAPFPRRESKPADTEVARALLDLGAGVESGELHAAVLGNNKQVAELLLENGARLDHRNDRGDLPIDLARKMERKELVDLFEQFD